MGDIANKFTEAFRDYITDGVPSSGAYEPDKALIRTIGAIIEATIASVGQGLNRYATIAARDAATGLTAGQLGYVYANNGSASDPANGVYQWSGSAWVAAAWYFSSIAAVVQPLVDEAQAAADDAADSAAEAAATAASIPAGLTPELVAAMISYISLAIPDGLNWDAGTPLSIYRSNDGWVINGLADIIQDAHGIDLTNAAICIHVDRNAGNNANTGIGATVGDFSSAVRDIWKAFQLGNALGVPFHVHLRKNQTWLRSFGFVHSTGSNQGQHSHAVTVEDNGQSTVTTYDDLTWTLDGTYTNCYRATRSTVARVYATDLTAPDGSWLGFTWYATPAALNTAGAVNGWTESGGNTYVRRADAAAVTNTNTKALLRLENYELTDNDVGAIYLKGIKFIGGHEGCVHVSRVTNMNVILENCEGMLPGALYSTSLVRPVFRLRNFGGLAIDSNCVGSGSLTDIFNYHTDTGTLQMYVVSNRPTTPDGIGDPVDSSSNNAWTLHEDVIGICVEPSFGTVRNGSTVRTVGTTKALIIGGTISNDDAIESGAAVIRTGGDTEGDPSTIWIVETQILGDGTFALRADGAGAIYKRNLKAETGGESTVGSGIIGTF